MNWKEEEIFFQKEEVHFFIMEKSQIYTNLINISLIKILENYYLY